MYGKQIHFWLNKKSEIVLYLNCRAHLDLRGVPFTKEDWTGTFADQIDIWRRPPGRKTGRWISPSDKRERERPTLSSLHCQF